MITGIVVLIVAKWTITAKIDEEHVKEIVRAEIDEGLVRIKAQLDAEATVHEIKFRKLYDKVSTVIETTFRLLTKTYRSGSYATDVGSTGDRQTAQDVLGSFRKDLGALVSTLFGIAYFSRVGLSTS